MIKYFATANTNKNGLMRGENYIVQSNHNGNVYVYDTEENFLMIHRTDSFDNWRKIE